MPQIILIAGIQYTIAYVPKAAGGETDLSNKTITIGTRNKKDMFNILLHEIGEALLHERGLRYTRYEEGNDGVRFIMTHHEYENLIGDIIAIVSQLKGLKSK